MLGDEALVEDSYSYIVYVARWAHSCAYMFCIKLSYIYVDCCSSRRRRRNNTLLLCVDVCLYVHDACLRACVYDCTIRALRVRLTIYLEGCTACVMCGLREDSTEGAISVVRCQACCTARLDDGTLFYVIDLVVVVFVVDVIDVVFK